MIRVPGTIRGDQPGPRVRHLVSLVGCSILGHWFDGQFCGRCGWFLP